MSDPPPLSQPADVSGTPGLGTAYPVGYQAFQPEDHGLDRGFRLTAFSEMKG